MAHGTINLSCDLVAFCAACDPTMNDGLAVYGFDELNSFACGCGKRMTSYGVSWFEYLAHGSNCSECVEAAERQLSESGSVILDAAQVNALTCFTELREIAAQAIAAGAN